MSTITAISTPSGAGGIGIVRISGNDAQKIADKVFRGTEKISQKQGYTALLGSVWDDEGVKIDECIALNFLEPKSFTGENTVELSCHGGMYVMKRVLAAVLAAGAVLAEPGEFTKRAFLNGKMDLTQAEAVMDIISAEGERARTMAISRKDGAISGKINEIKEQMLSIGASLAAWADYPDDDVPQIDEAVLKNDLEKSEGSLFQLLNTFDSGRIIREGVNTVIAGRPNAGKSTLMNLLSGSERSIVTDFAGTTRDIVEESVMLGDIKLRLSDTAGIRETDDLVESIGVRMARDRLREAELVLAVFDASDTLDSNDLQLIDSIRSKPAIAVVNKTDLSIKVDLPYILNNFKHIVYISAKNGEGLLELQKTAEAVLKTDKIASGEAVLATERQRDAVRRSLECVREAAGALKMGLTLDAVTVSLEAAISSLLELTGEKVSEAVVAQVFETFCVGK